jgi:hypothetical protein
LKRQYIFKKKKVRIFNAYFGLCVPLDLNSFGSHCAPASLNQNVALFAKILRYRLKYTPGIKFLATLISLKSSQHGGQMAHFEITKSHF